MFELISALGRLSGENSTKKRYDPYTEQHIFSFLKKGLVSHPGWSDQSDQCAARPGMFDRSRSASTSAVGSGCWPGAHEKMARGDGWQRFFFGEKGLVSHSRWSGRCDHSWCLRGDA